MLGGHRLWHAPEVPELTYRPDESPVTVTHVVELRHGPEAEVGFADSTALRTVMALYEAGGIPRTDQARTALASAIGRLTEGTRSATLRLGRIDLPFP